MQKSLLPVFLGLGGLAILAAIPIAVFYQLAIIAFLTGFCLSEGCENQAYSIVLLVCLVAYLTPLVLSQLSAKTRNTVIITLAVGTLAFLVGGPIPIFVGGFVCGMMLVATLGAIMLRNASKMRHAQDR